MTTTMYPEKRKFSRVESHVPVRYRKLDEPWSVMKKGTITRNISKGGLSFMTGEFISKACRIVMELDISGSKPVRAISRVTWIKKSAYGENFNVGNQFLEMSAPDKDVLFSYIDGAVVQG